jgi:hypothetical protein
LTTLSENKGFPTFREFIDSATSATPEDYLAHPTAKVANEEAFREMQRHIAQHYEGIEVTHSFADDNGQVFDCVPIEQQPSLRGLVGEIPKPPDLPYEGGGKAGTPGELQVEPQLRPDQKDQYGNARWCPTGTIPMRRITLEEMIRFESLDKFFRKSPVGGRHPHLSAPRTPEENDQHRYAHAYQFVDNWGGLSKITLWQPPVVGPDQIFSLSQVWYTGGHGAQLQTVEAGWQVYPTKYGNPNACLFIYWTADDYQHGCYNLDCTAFAQTNHTWTLGGAFSQVSTPGGTQYLLQFGWILQPGVGWWLFLASTDASDAVGYYPISLFQGGQLASNATRIDYGGETCSTGSWPQMGSGAFASAGHGQAAYQRNIVYELTGIGGTTPANLTPSQESPNCYTVAPDSSGDWGTFIYFGGPGGNC